MPDGSGFVPVADPRPVDPPWPAVAEWPPPTDLVLTGEHVELRQSQPDDALDLFVALDDQLSWMHLPVDQPYKVHELRAMIEEARRVRVPWTVRLRARGEVVGWTSVLDTSVRDARTEIGFTQYTSAVWGTAVNPECKLLLMTHLFEVATFGRVQFKTDVRNVRSQAAIARLGAHYEALLRRYQRRADGSVRDSVLFSVTAEEWPQVRAGLQARLASPELRSGS